MDKSILRWIMLDERKVKLMTKLAFYEQTQGKEDFKISEYYRKDYAGMHVICSVIWVTIGYACAVGLILMAGLESLMEKMSGGLMVMLALVIVIGYIALLLIYGIVSSHVYNKKHKDARRRVKRYNHGLIKLLKMYEKESK